MNSVTAIWLSAPARIGVAPDLLGEIGGRPGMARRGGQVAGREGWIDEVVLDGRAQGEVVARIAACFLEQPAPARDVVVDW